MKAFLIVVSGAKPQRFALTLPTTIGRGAESGLKVKAAAISRRHCELYEFEGELAVRDLGSSNGTFVNDERIDEPCFLSPGDELRVGGVGFQADYELPEGHAQEVLQSEALVADEEIADEDIHAEEPASQIQLHKTKEGSFLSIEDGVPPAADFHDDALREFLQGMD